MKNNFEVIIYITKIEDIDYKTLYIGFKDYEEKNDLICEMYINLFEQLTCGLKNCSYSSNGNRFVGLINENPSIETLNSRLKIMENCNIKN